MHPKAGTNSLTRYAAQPQCDGLDMMQKGYSGTLLEYATERRVDVALVGQVNLYDLSPIEYVWHVAVL